MNHEPIYHLCYIIYPNKLKSIEHKEINLSNKQFSGFTSIETKDFFGL